MKATKALKELPWPEQSVCNIKQVDYIVFSQFVQSKQEKLLVVTFNVNTIKPNRWGKPQDFRLILSAEQRDYTVLYKGDTESNKLPWFDNCYPEISPKDETRIRAYLSLETPWTGKAAAAKDTEDGNHQMLRLHRWCGSAYDWQKEERKRRRGEIEDEAVWLCPEELPEGLIGYINNAMLPEDEVLLYKRGNVRGTCYACRQKVRAVAPNRFRQGEYTYCPECGKKVACVLEGGMNFKADYVNNLAAFQLGADGKTLFIRQWHLTRDPTAQWNDIPKQLVECTRYAMRGNRVAKWSHEEKYAWGYMGPAVREQRKAWERVKGTKVYDGGYYFFLDEALVSRTALRYAGIGDYIENKQTRQGRDVIRFALDSARYPVMEFLFKAGYYRLLREAIQGTEHRHAIRWNAKKLKDAFRFPLRMLKTREPEEWSFSELWALSQIWEKWGAQKSDRELLDIMMLRTRLGENGEDMVLPFTTAARAGAYLRAQERQESGAGNLYKDYLKDCTELGLNLRDKQVLFPPHLREAHDRTISMKKVKANDKIRGAFSKAAKKGRKWNLTGKRLLIRVAESPEELIRANSRARDAETERDRILRETEESRERILEAMAERDRAKLAAAEAEERETSARKAAEEAEQRAKDTAEDLKKAKEAMQKALDAKKKALDELKAARADKSVPAETLEKLRREAEEAARKALEAEGGGKSVQEAAAKLEEAEQAAAEARQRADEMASDARRYAEEKEALEKQLRLAAPEMAVFKARFERVQKELLALVGSVDELPADKQAGAWKAMAALAGQISRIVEAHTEGVRA